MFEGPIEFQKDDQDLLREMEAVEAGTNAHIQMAVLCVTGSIRHAAKILCNPPNPVVRGNMVRMFANALASLEITEEQYDAAVASGSSAVKLIEGSAKFQDALRVARGQQQFVQWEKPKRR